MWGLFLFGMESNGLTPIQSLSESLDPGRDLGLKGTGDKALRGGRLRGLQQSSRKAAPGYPPGHSPGQVESGIP